MAVLLPKVAAAAVVCSIDWDSTNWWRGDHRPLEPTWHLARTWGMSAWGHWHWHWNQGMLPPSASEALVPCATGRTYFHKHTFKTEGQNLAIHHLTSFVPKMNNLYYVNQPPFYIAYSNCMQRRWWQPLLLTHTCLVWHCLFSMHTIASNTLEQLWVNQKDIDMENMLMAFLLSGPGTKSLRRHFWLKSRITFFSWVWGISHFNLVLILRWTLWILHTLLVQFSSCPDQERRTYSILLAVTALRQSRHDATRPISN